MRLPSSKHTLVASSVTLIPALYLACSPVKNNSRLRNSADDIFVAVFDKKTDTDPVMLVSTPAKVDADLCLTLRDGTCDAAAQKFPLEEYSNTGGRFIYRPTTAPNLSTFQDYLLVNKTGAQMLRFRLRVPGSNDTLEQVLGRITVKTLQDELMFLTQDKFNGRLAGTPENDQLADFLIDELKKLNIAPVFGEYRQKFRMTVGPTSGTMSSNIVGLIEGSDPKLKNEYVVIGAHMDHTGTLEKGYTCGQGTSGDRICNGADDNGSGTIALLNVAKSLASVRSSLKRSVFIMWFSGEEEGLLGSRHYVANPAVPLAKHVFMINLDMVGYAKTFGNAIAAIGTSTSPWADSTARAISKRYPNYKMKFTDKVEGGSDHAPFMNKGIPGVFYHTGVSNNPNYHRTSDHVEKIDFDGMLAASKIALETVVAAGSAPELSRPNGFNLSDPALKYVSDAEAAKGCHYLTDYKYVD
jgi:hypothetical protein